MLDEDMLTVKLLHRISCVVSGVVKMDNYR